MTSLPICGICDKGFDMIEAPPWLCDPCERWAHQHCGEQALINNRSYFFCRSCNDS